MPHSARVFWCRTAFVLFCLVPTLIVAGWLVRRSRPEFIAAEKLEWQRELSQRLGLAVSIGKLSYPNYYTARLDNVRLVDAETGAVAAHVRSLEIARVSSGWIIEASQPEIDLSALSRVGTLVHDRLFRSEIVAGACELSARELTLRSDGRALTLANVTALCDTSAGGGRMTVNFQLAGQSPAAEPSQLMLTRNLQHSPPVTRWELQTGADPLPCSLLGGLFPPVEYFGSDISFQGAAWCIYTEQGLSGEVTGTLEHVELDRLVTEHFPHQLSGLAKLHLAPARIEEGRLTALRGTRQGADGRISSSLLVAAQAHLALTADPAASASPPGHSTAFRHLSIGFQLDENGLSLTGSADPTRDGVLLASAAGILLEAPPRHQVPAVALIRTLAPDSQTQVPATMQTNVLVRTLPLSNLVPAQTTAREIGHLPTRLAPASSFDESQAVREGKLK